MNLTNKIKKYHVKKRNDAFQELKIHKNLKKKLMSEFNNCVENELKLQLQKQIENENKLILIWKNNIEKINKQIKKIN